MASSSQPREHAVTHATFAPFKFAWHLLASGLLVWFVSMMIQISYVRYYHLNPDAHMEQQINYYVDKAPSKGLVEALAFKAYWLVFEATSFQRLVSSAPKPADASTQYQDPLGKSVHRTIWAAYRQDLIVVAYGTVLFGVKAAIVLFVIPLFFILLVAAGIDGLVQRSIRRACGGNESDTLYHRAKLYGTKLLPPFAIVIFFCSPVAFEAAWLFVPCAFVSAALLRIQATYYKKYI